MIWIVEDEGSKNICVSCTYVKFINFHRIIGYNTVSGLTVALSRLGKSMKLHSVFNYVMYKP